MVWVLSNSLRFDSSWSIVSITFLSPGLYCRFAHSSHVPPAVVVVRRHEATPKPPLALASHGQGESPWLWMRHGYSAGKSRCWISSGRKCMHRNLSLPSRGTAGSLAGAFGEGDTAGRAGINLILKGKKERTRHNSYLYYLRETQLQPQPTPSPVITCKQE